MPTQSAAERRSYAIRQLNDQGHLSVSNLSEELDVSTVTIRKDLQYLEDRNLLIRTHGGAIRPDHYAYDLSLDEKAKRHEAEKKRIGRKAADLVADKDTLVIDSGTTAMQVVRNLDGKKDLTAATGSVHIARELLRLSEVNVLMLGGRLRRTSASAVGHYAEQMMREHSFRKFFLAVDGFDVDYGLTTTNDSEAHLNRLMVESSEETIAIVDSSKFGRRGLSYICKPNDVDIVITDDNVSDRDVRRLEEAEVQVLIA